MMFALSVIASVAFLVYVTFFEKSYPVHDRGVVLITGSSTGIGRHAAEHLVTTTDYKVFAGVRKQKDYDDILNLHMVRLIPLMMDVTNHDSCVKAIKIIEDVAVAEQLPFVALVNNAGVSREVPAEFHDINDAKMLFDTNFWGIVDLVQLALPMLRESKGRIVMLS